MYALQIDGAQAAAAFANYAFFSLFPLLILFVTIASFFVNQEQAGTAVLSYLRDYVPITGELQHSLFETLTGVVNARGPASLIAVRGDFSHLGSVTRRTSEKAPAFMRGELSLVSGPCP